MTFDEIVWDLLLYGFSEDSKKAIRRVYEDDIAYLNETVGPLVQTRYRLRDSDNPLTLLNYVAQVVDGVDINPKHPDNVSHQLLRAVWRKLQ